MESLMKIYKLTPEPKLMGSFNNGILKINGKEFKTTEEEVLNRFNRGYWRCGSD